MTKANPFAKLIAKKEPTHAGTPEGSTGNAEGASAPAEQSADVAESTEQQAAPTPAAAAPVRPANPFGNRKPSGAGPAPESASPAGSPASTDSGNAVANKPRLAGLSLSGVKPAAQPVDNAPVSISGGPSLSLDELSESTDAGIAPKAVGVSGFFADETPATKPTRELPEGLTKEELGFVETIDSVYDFMHDPDLLGGVIRNIIIELSSNPAYMRLVAPDDVRQWVRGMRESMGLAKIKKQETKSRRSTAKSKTVDTDMLADLESLGISLDI